MTKKVIYNKRKDFKKFLVEESHMIYGDQILDSFDTEKEAQDFQEKCYKECDEKNSNFTVCDRDEYFDDRKLSYPWEEIDD